MKRLLTLTIVSLTSMSLCFAEDAPPAKTFLLKITERDKKVTYQLKSPDDYKSLKAEIDQERACSSKAMAASEQEWRKDPELGKKFFPQTAIGEKSVEKLAEFTDSTKAEAKLKSYEDQEAKKADAIREKEKAKSKSNTKEDQKRLERERDHDLLNTRARDMFDAKLTELVQAAKNKDTKPDDKPKDDKK